MRTQFRNRGVVQEIAFEFRDMECWVGISDELESICRGLMMCISNFVGAIPLREKLSGVLFTLFLILVMPIQS